MESFYIDVNTTNAIFFMYSIMKLIGAVLILTCFVTFLIFSTDQQDTDETGDPLLMPSSKPASLSRSALRGLEVLPGSLLELLILI